MRRRTIVFGLAGAAILGAGAWFMLRRKGPEIGFTLSDDELAAALALMSRSPMIDAHAHPGRTFVRDADRFGDWKVRLYAMLGAFEDKTVAQMKEGRVAAAVFNGVADFQLLALGSDGLAPGREFEEGEAWASYQRQIANLRALQTRGLVTICTSPQDVLDAHVSGTPGAILAMEGTDFLETDLGRMDTMFADGVRMATLVHYHNNSVGHIMTDVDHPDTGLTSFGADVVARADELGIMIDLSHASEKTAFDILSLTRQPAVLTHTHVNDPALTHPRFVSRELAQAVAEQGGYVGAWPAGIGQGTLAEFVDRIEWLLDIMGPDHVAMGSDMDANYKPVLETYTKMPLVIGALLKRGHDEATVTRMMGGNFLRVWRATEGQAA